MMKDDVPAALRRYEELRKPRATRLQEASEGRTRIRTARTRVTVCSAHSIPSQSYPRTRRARTF